MLTRKIIHIDMDCFYAAVEMRENPALANRPVAVGGGSRRGVVTTCNYVAREFGVRSAMPGFMARERCPELIFLPVRFELYRAESQKIRSVLHQYSPLVEPLSLDEAFLDVSHHDRYAWDLAREIRGRIYEQTRLTASAGIAPNKMLAKIASDWRKPNGQFAVTPEQVESFMAELPVKKIWGVGPKSAEKFAAHGIDNCGQLQQLSKTELIQQFGRWGEELYRLCRGIDERPVEPNRIRKSLSNERTYADHLIGPEACRSALVSLVDELLEDLSNKAPDRLIHKAFVKVKFADFTKVSRECLSSQVDRHTYFQLLDKALSTSELPVRLLGAGVRFAETEKSPAPAQQEWDFRS